MDRFSKDGRLIYPLGKRKKGTKELDEDKVRYVVTEAYCPNGCNIIDHEHKINDAAGLKFKFKRAGMEGYFILSAIEGDLDKIILSGELEDGVKDELYCPHCDVMFKKLINCSCKPNADMVIVGLTSKLDFNNAISFCNVTGCTIGTSIKSGDAILRARLRG